MYSALFLIPAGGNATITISEDPQFNTNPLFATCYIEASGDISERDWFCDYSSPNMWKTFWFRPPLTEFKAFCIVLENNL